MTTRSILGLALCAITAGLSQEQSVSKKDIPPGILETFRSSYPCATITGDSREVKNGITSYEIESVDAGVHCDITYAVDASLISIEESLAFSSLPEPVHRIVTTLAKDGSILFCEKIIKADTLRYEVHLTADAGKLEVVLNPDGNIVSTENK